MSGTLWTDKEIEILKAMAEKGMLIREIHQVLKSRTIESIYNKANKLGILFQEKKPEIDMDAFKKMMRE